MTFLVIYKKFYLSIHIYTQTCPKSWLWKLFSCHVFYIKGLRSGVFRN